ISSRCSVYPGTCWDIVVCIAAQEQENSDAQVVALGAFRRVRPAGTAFGEWEMFLGLPAPPGGAGGPVRSDDKYLGQPRGGQLGGCHELEPGPRPDEQ